MKYKSFILPIVILFLSACVHIDSLHYKLSDNSQAMLYGWVTFNQYISPKNTSIDIEICQISETQCIIIGKQEYKGVQLPVKYSFVIAPIQAGNGEMKIRAALLSQGEIRASKEEHYIFTYGETHQDLNIVDYKH